MRISEENEEERKRWAERFIRDGEKIKELETRVKELEEFISALPWGSKEINLDTPYIFRIKQEG